ncbi:MAG: tRNA epoxyqueuosine(34) reductase QueG [Polyangiaceae bacterium]|nr:tRNA epoxyqueuosine(34) reductase QueG [Polyangiaceae bacterium]
MARERPAYFAIDLSLGGEKSLARLRPHVATIPSELPAGARVHHPQNAAKPLAPQAIVAALVARAPELGLSQLAVTSAEPLEQADANWQRWLKAGHHGEMDYLGDGERADPRALMPTAKSVICVAMPYATNASLIPAERLLSGAGSDTPRGQVAAYAQGRDYHPLLWNRLLALGDFLADLAARPILARPCVDTAPLLERAIAARAGLGFVGKNGLVIAPGGSSLLLLGELLVDFDLPVGAPIKDRCGECTKCLDACPTAAFVGPYILDATRCISYLTIELQDAIPRELRAPIGTRVFGCDVCQTVCPFNGSSARARAGCAPELASTRDGLSLIELLELGASRYRSVVRRTALRRVSRVQLARNAAVALGNLGDRQHKGALFRAAAQHSSPMVREHAAWALGRLGAESELRTLSASGQPEAVRVEACRSLAELLDRAADAT